MHRPGIFNLLILVLTAFIVTGCGTTKQSVPGLACTALAPGLRLSQGFVAHGDSLTSARILVKTLNHKRRRSEPLTLALLDRHNEVVAEASQSVKMGYKGWVEFHFPEPGVDLHKGDRYFLRVTGSRSLPFGWYQRQNFYSQGVAYQNGIARPGLDWYFKLVWATSEAPYQVASHKPAVSQQSADQFHAALYAATL